MKKKHIKLLKRIVETPSPTGFEVGVANVVRDVLGDTANEIRTDTMGSVHASLTGASYEESLGVGFNGGSRVPTLMFAAHMDEIGLMVSYISDEGFLSFSAIGGLDAAILPGTRVMVHTHTGDLEGVIGRKPIHLIDADERKKPIEMTQLVIDVGLSSKKVRNIVSVGDPVTFNVGFERMGDNMAVSRAFDDKVGVFIGCRVMQKLSSNPSYSGNFIAAMTVQEEIGTRGAITSAFSVNPDVAIAFDVTHATDYPGIDKAKNGDIKCGGGPVIARGPNINPAVFDRLVLAAKEEGIAYQIEAEPSVTGTDARSIQVSRGGIPTGLVSVALRYMHTQSEVIDLRDVQDTIRLITRFALDLDEATSFVPGFSDVSATEASFADEDSLAGDVYGSDTDEDDFYIADAEGEKIQPSIYADYATGVAEYARNGEAIDNDALDDMDDLDGFEPQFARYQKEISQELKDYGVSSSDYMDDEDSEYTDEDNEEVEEAASYQVRPAIKITLEENEVEESDIEEEEYLEDVDEESNYEGAFASEDASLEDDGEASDTTLDFLDDIDEEETDSIEDGWAEQLSFESQDEEAFSSISVIDSSSEQDDEEKDGSDTMTFEAMGKDGPTMSVPIVSVEQLNEQNS